ncbi:MAG: Ig-like domain-containing protein [Candidatus Saganbacteria bacterium]|nr:Ig-like domain-containing protein [Candidatus Saganbacteria bacterium]
MKKYLLLILILSLLTGGLAGAARAISSDTPATSVLNPVTETLYVIENDTDPRIKVYDRNDTPGWAAASSYHQSLPAGSKCYGLAVNSAGDKLYASVNNGTSSLVRVYTLNASGRPTSSVDMTGAPWPAGSSPAGLALDEANNRLFVADKGLNGIRTFNTSTNAYVSWISGTSDPHFDVAVSGSKVFVSNKGITGKIHVYNNSGGTLTYNTSFNTGSQTYPTYLKVANSKLYVAVSGYGGTDVKVYNTSSHALTGSVQNGDVSATYGWTGIDISNGGTWLVFKKARDAAETTNSLYAIETADISGTVTADRIVDSVNRSDGVVLALDRSRAALTNSPTGGIQIVNIQEDIGNHVPAISGLVQYKEDETTVIPANGTTNEDHIVVSFTVNDEDGDTVTPTVRYAEFGHISGPSAVEVTGTPSPAGTTFKITIPDTGAFADGDYEWGVKVTDGSTTTAYTMYNNGGSADFTVDSNAIINPGAPHITATDPSNSATDVALDSPINVTFDETIKESSLSVDISPTVSGVSYAWNASHTELTINHSSDLASNQLYTVTVSATDVDNNSLAAGSVANPFSFTTAANNLNPPGDFSKTSPADGADECCDVSLQWGVSTDPDGPAPTYNVYVYDADSHALVYSETDIAGTAHSIPLATLTADTTYEWNVSANDGIHTTWANGAESAVWTFTYINGITNPGNPYITATSPLDSATDVYIDAAVSITFNESIQAGSFTYTIVPAVTGASVSWNPTHTVATISHDDFAASTPYTVTVTNAIDVDESLALTGDNDFAFTTGTGSGSDDPILNIIITREGDDPGDDITITWDTDPVGLGVDVYELVCTYDEPSESYTSYFTTDPAGWTAVATNVTIGSYTISSSVGDGTARYYKLIPNGETLVSGDLTEEVVAKFDIAVGPSDTEPERFFISIPIEVADTSVSAVIGGQVEEMDMILSFDINKDVTYGSMYSGGIWDTFPGAIGPISNMEAGYTYGYYSPTAKFITAVGMLPETDYSRTLNGAGGSDLVSEWIANPYPMPVGVADAGLNASSHSSVNPAEAGTAYQFDADANLIDTTNGIAFHYDASAWRDGTLTAPSPLLLVPGKGYMFTEPVQSSFSWSMTKPY